MAIGAGHDAQLCGEDQDLCRYRQIRTMTFGRLCQAGFAVLASFGRPHYEMCCLIPTTTPWDRLEGSFDPARAKSRFRAGTLR